MSWLDAILLPIVMTAWLFLSYDAVNKLCLKRGWPMHDRIGMILCIIVGFAGGANIMLLFNVFWPSSCFLFVWNANEDSEADKESHELTNICENPFDGDLFITPTD